MRIEDFMQPRQVGKVVENKYTFIYELKNYTGISKDKLELIESIKDYIKYYPINAEIDYYTGHERTTVQCETNDGNRVLVEFDLLSIYDDDDSYTHHNATQSITEEEFYKRANKYKKVGAQRFNRFWFEVESQTWNTIIYSEDGRIFVDETTANTIRKTQIDKLGERLSWGVKGIRSSDWYDDRSRNDVLRRRFEKGINKRLYQVKDGVLYNATGISDIIYQKRKKRD